MIKYPSTTAYQDLMGRVAAPPAVSILLPLHPVLGARGELQHRVKIALENVRHQLLKTYTSERVGFVMEKLEGLRQQLHGDIRQKSVGLFASALKSRLVFLESTVEERIFIGESFAVRELVADSKQLRNYLILVLTDQECQFYLAGGDRLERLRTGTPADVFAYVNEKPERVANCSDAAARREIVMDKFLHHIDEELSHILALHPLPVFVLGPERVIGHFKAQTRHLPQIAACVYGSYAEAGEGELRELVRPCLALWQQHNRQMLLSLVKTAVDENKLSTGIDQAQADATRKNGRLLIVENSFNANGLDELIGGVVAQGGDVDFVDDGALREYQRIALVRYY